MAARRRHFGRIRQLPSGRWQVRYLGPDGLDHPGPRTFDTKGDAERWMAAAQTDLARGQWIDPSAGRITVAEWAAIWMQNRPDLKARTFEL